VQYAERLLEGKPLPSDQTPLSLANHFVKHYKDHGFVIDADEARKLLGPKIVRTNTAEYQFANDVHESLDLLKFLGDVVVNKEFEYVGGIDDGLLLRKKPK